MRLDIGARRPLVCKPGARDIAARLMKAKWPGVIALQAAHALAQGLTAYRTEYQGKPYRVEVVDM